MRVGVYLYFFFLEESVLCAVAVHSMPLILICTVDVSCLKFPSIRS